MSDWKISAAARRDERATKREPEPEPHGRKSTRRWCKGKVGREHTKLIELDPKLTYFGTRCNATSWFPCRHHEICSVCGKQLRWTLPVKECPILSKQGCVG